MAANGGTISLESALRTCRVDSGWANKVQSSRFLDPALMVCPVWNGLDNAGRKVCPDSFVTKTAGCNSATDRVIVENNVSRPQYMEYITLSANGIKGNIYGDNSIQQSSQVRTRGLKNALNYAGHFSTQFGGEIYPSCGMSPYDNYSAHQADNNRRKQAMQQYYEGYTRKAMSGF